LVVVYVLELVFSAAVGTAGNSGIAVAMSVLIWFRLQSVVVGVYETIEAVVGWFVIAVGEAVVCAATCFLQRHHFLLALLETVLASVPTDSAEVGCPSVSAAVGLFLTSREITATLNALNVSSISGGKGIPSSFGQSCWSLWLVCSSFSRVPVSGFKKVGDGAVGGAVVGRFATAGVDEAVVCMRSSLFLLSTHLFHSVSPYSIHSYQKRKMSFSTFANRDDMWAVDSRL
jgi:hypothetical protein